MSLSLILLLLTAVIVSFLYPLFINFLYKFQLREPINPDIPDSHRGKTGTPTAGALLPIVVFLIILGVANPSADTLIVMVIVGGLAVLGFLEDFFKIYHRSRLQRTIRKGIVPIVTLSDLSWNVYKILLFPWNAFREVFRALGSQNAGGIAPYQKILFQTALGAGLASWIVFTSGTSLWVPFAGEVNLGAPLFGAFVITLFLFFVNSISVTDGLDGLVGGLLAIGFSGLLALTLTLGRGDLALACAVLVGGILPFLYFNIYPARVFAGNVGALAWAGAFVSILFLADRALVLPILGGVFLAEGLSVVLQVGAVKLGKERIFLMAPLHHHFEMKGWSETKVTMRFWLAAAALSFLGLLVSLF